MAAIAQRILDDAPPRFALAGLSMGGYIAFAMMRLAPERIAKLALLDTSARPDTPEQSAGRKKFRSPWRRPAATARSSRLLMPRYRASRSSARRGAHGDRAHDGRGNRAGGLRAPAEGDHVARRIRGRCCRQIRCPTLVLVGDGDELTPPELAKEIAGGIAGSRLVVVPDCGHLSTIEQPEPVNAALAAMAGGVSSVR